MTYIAGDKVIYLTATNATVQSVTKNGVWIAFWGKGIRDGEYVRHRVSCSDIRLATEDEQ